jgi:hypothetical protein
MNDSRAVEIGSRPRFVPSSDRLRAIRSVGGSNRRSNSFVSWLLPIGVFLPATIGIYIGDEKLTPARVTLLFLLIPSLLTFFGKGRNFVAADFLVGATAALMIITVGYLGTGVATAAGEALEFLGYYLVARAYIFGLPPLEAFIRSFKVVTFTIVLLAAAEEAAGRNLVQDTITSIFNFPPVEAIFRLDLLRATSVFEHAILYGTFCALAAAILIYADRNAGSRIVSAATCTVGALLSVSSAPLIALGISFGVYIYDRLLNRYPSRWLVFWGMIVASLGCIFSFSNDGLGFIVTNLTLDPQTGYYRMWIWDAGFAQLATEPLTGHGFARTGNEILDHSVDSVWLLVALHYGILTVLLLFLSNVACVVGFKKAEKKAVLQGRLGRLATAFTLVILMYCFVGLTVDFWHSMWQFWAICLGIRASIKEYSLGCARSRYD